MLAAPAYPAALWKLGYSTSLCTPCNPVAGIPSHGPPSAGCAAGHRTASSNYHTTQEATPEIFCLNMNKLHLKGSPTLGKEIKTKGYPTLLFQKTTCKLQIVGLSNPCKRHQNIKGLSNPSFPKNKHMQARKCWAVQPLQKTSKHQRAIQPFFFKKANMNCPMAIQHFLPESRHQFHLSSSVGHQSSPPAVQVLCPPHL